MTSYLFAIVVTLSLLFSKAYSADGDDPEDLSFLKKGAAIGDSYTAGIGAGNSVAYWCSRYDGSYPSLVAMQLGVAVEELDFTFTACSGAVVDQIIDQADHLSSGQQFIMMSAGGNDAGPSDILDSCVYKFSLIAGDKCSKELDKANEVIESEDFHAKVDDLLDLAKTKLSDDGNIYYVGYAKFFEVSDNACDDVTWHLWNPFRAQVYLTQDVRQRMNDLVDLMNDALRSASERAGPRVHFIDYDQYVGMTSGRFCQPGDDESDHRSADRTEAFFYEMKTSDIPLLDLDDDWHTDLKKRSSNDESDYTKNHTLGVVYGALVQGVVDSGQSVSMSPENADEELRIDVMDYQIRKNKAKGLFVVNGINSTNGSTLRTATNKSLPINGSVVESSANDTILSGGELAVVERLSFSEVLHLVLPDTSARVFHPTQRGHNVIANLVLYTMAAVNAESMGIDFPAEVVNGTSSALPGIGERECKDDSSDTWADRDAMRSAVEDFCKDLSNTRGLAGTTTNATSNLDSLDYVKVSIDWEEDGAIEEHSCMAWLNVITDGCDVPDEDSGANAENLKHGGSIAYYSDSVNATFNIDSLVMRRIWSGGQATTHNCSEQKYYHIDQETLKSNVEDYCEKLSGFTDGIATAGAEFFQVYNDDSADRVTLKTEWPTGERSYQIFKEECEYYMNVIYDDCTAPDENSSGEAWNHGGEMSDNNGVRYTIEPSEFRRSGNFFVGNGSIWNSSSSWL